jgi:preprotein translocase subunit SecD
MGNRRFLLALIVILVLTAVTVLIQVPLKLGLDLRGGTQLTLQVQTTEAVPQITPEKLESVQKVIENRINGLGVAEALIVPISGNNQLVVQLPGVADPAQAERVLGGTAQLDFREQKQGTEAQLRAELTVRQEKLLQQEALQNSTDEKAINDNKAAIQQSDEAIAALFNKTNLTGDKLKRSYAQPYAGDAWEVGIEFNEAGGQEFAEITKNIAGTGRGIGIFLDNRLLSAPVVDAKYAATGITGGRASITGNFDAKSAGELSIQLNGGALPVPVTIIENRTVGATLGRDSIQRSIYAGLVGLFLVLVFMVWYYRLPGLIADISLIIYALLNLMIFALIPVTLTLPGIAGFILSIGMAVDANVLIFERTREELQAGKTLYRSVEAGFYRAFSSILDSNVTTLIACAALGWLGTGLVRGFAVTLAIGVCVSMFTALTCSRTLLLFSLGFPALRKPSYFSPNVPDNLSQAKAS